MLKFQLLFNQSGLMFLASLSPHADVGLKNARGQPPPLVQGKGGAGPLRFDSQATFFSCLLTDAAHPAT